ncbi:hypothetical protein [Campylobacter sp.]|uniref:hypothetical protein n=1 Tax=Campylobacter sp. TaxID=205 RepID=UPI0027043645|nr:hypothetical protein [Campylobacter sp.]
MLEKILDDEKFALLMKMHIYECIDYLFQNNQPFSVMVNLDLVKFTPELPSNISASFKHPVIVFTLDGYTFESAKLTQDELSFEAGFGPDNFASLVSFPLGAIIQILVENSAILVNFSIHKEKDLKNKTEKSMSVFLSNPKNREFFKK